MEKQQLKSKNKEKTFRFKLLFSRLQRFERSDCGQAVFRF